MKLLSSRIIDKPEITYNLHIQNDHNYIIQGGLVAANCHTFKSDCCKGIFEKASEVKYRFGVTGSLDKSAVNKMVLRGMIGEISREKSTRDLIDEGYLSDIKIGCVILKYSKETKRLLKEVDYQHEISFLIDHEKRNRFIIKLALACKGTTLLLFNHVAHGEKLYEDIKSKATTQECHLVCGKVEADERESIRRMVQESKGDSIILGSVGTMAVGINLPSINNIIFAHPTKSVIRLIQSLGRGLRKSEGKTHLNLYDIVDAISTNKTSPNFVYRHFIERLRIYTEEKHNYKLMEVQLEE